MTPARKKLHRAAPVKGREAPGSSKRDLLGLSTLSRGDVDWILGRAKVLKDRLKKRSADRTLEGKTLGMIFEKSSTRTRVSFEVGMFQLGGQAIFLSPRDLQMGRGEPIKDTARTLSRYVDAILMRGYGQCDLEEMAAHATVPVINGLTDLLHPCQILADLFTIVEKKGSYAGVSVAYVGDGNNIANSWIEGAALCGFPLAIACPRRYPPSLEIVDRARAGASAPIVIVHDPEEAVRGADVISTDVWVSMGQETEEQEKIAALRGFQIDSRLVSKAKKDVIVMHCLPAHRGEEITEEVLEGPNSVVFDQAENRLHIQKAVLEFLLCGPR